MTLFCLNFHYKYLKRCMYRYFSFPPTLVRLSEREGLYCLLPFNRFKLEEDDRVRCCRLNKRLVIIISLILEIIQACTFIFQNVNNYLAKHQFLVLIFFKYLIFLIRWKKTSTLTRYVSRSVSFLYTYLQECAKLGIQQYRRAVNTKTQKPISFPSRLHHARLNLTL